MGLGSSDFKGLIRSLLALHCRPSLIMIILFNGTHSPTKLVDTRKFNNYNNNTVVVIANTVVVIANTVVVIANTGGYC